MKKYFIIFSFFIHSMFSVSASTNKCIYITSDQLPYAIVAEITDQKINIYPFYMQSLDYDQKDLETFFHFNITHYVDLDLSSFPSSHPILTFDDVKVYLKQIVQNLDYSIIFKINQYIDSNLSIADYISLFDLIKQPYPTAIYYPSYLLYNNQLYFLNNHFTTT